jgi:hypothetical protein
MIRKITISLWLLAAMFAAGTLSAQKNATKTLLLNEGFENETFPPSGWVMLDVDGDSRNWYRGQNVTDPVIACNTGSGCAVSLSYVENEDFSVNNYLISPKIAVPATGSIKLSFWLGRDKNYTGGYIGDMCTVLVSTSDTDPASFTYLDYFNVLSYQEGYNNIELSLDSYAGQEIHIAFQHNNSWGYHLLLDDVSVEYTPADGGEDAVVIAVGTGDDHAYVPVNFYYNESASQSLYYAGEMGINGGVIDSISYITSNYGLSYTSTAPVKIWIGETDKTDFADLTWVDVSELTQVFESTITIPQAAESELIIPFTTPYTYNGGNLLIYAVKLDVNYASDKYFQTTNTPGVAKTILRNTDDTGSITPENPGTGTAAQYFPNVSFFMNTGGMGGVSGVVSNANGEALEGVKVEIEGTPLYAMTNADGEYEFAHLMPDTYTLKATMHGYTDATAEITITENGSETANIIMEGLTGVTIRGTVTMAGTDTPIEGAIITLTGYDSYEATSSTDGTYSIEDVYASESYTMTVTAEEFLTYTATVEVETVDVVHDVVLNETPRPTGQVIAEVNGDNNASIKWFNPNTPVPNRFYYNSGVRTAHTGFNGTYLNSVTDLIHRVPATSMPAPKALVNYSVYRLVKGQDETEWTLIGTTADTAYVDNTWAGLPAGIYRYAVKVNYTGNTSPATQSDDLEKDMEVQVTVTLTTNSDDPVMGAFVTLENQDTDHAYGMFANSGTVVFPKVWKGTYDLSVTLEGFETYTEAGIVIDDGISLDVELTEIIVTPFGLLVEPADNDADRLFSWNNTPDAVEVTVTAGDIWGDGTGYQFLLDNTAELFGVTIPATGSMSNNCSVPATLYDVFSHKLPENADPVCTTANIIVNTAATIWIEPGTYDFCFVNPVPEQTLYIANSSNGSYGRFDDFEFEEGKKYTFTITIVGENDFVALSVEDVVKNNTTKSFIGYTVYLDEEEKASDVTDTRYLFEGLENGTYKAGVKAVYSSGESEIVYSDEFTVTIPVSEYTVTFTVTDKDANPVEGATIVFNGETLSGYTAENVVAGEYEYTVSKAGYITTTGKVEVINQDVTVPVTLGTVGIDANSIAGIRLYPNPFTDEIMVSNSAAVKHIQITNVAGQKVKDIAVGGKTISTGELPSGVYFVTIESITGEKAVYKMVKK